MLEAGSNRNRDVWVIDVARGARSRITADQADDVSPRWLPDGRSLVFGSNRKGPRTTVLPFEIYQKSVSGIGNEQLLLADAENSIAPRAVSSDGRYVVYTASKGGTEPHDLWMMPQLGDRKSSPFLQTPFQEYLAEISPDGRWVAYVTNESGRPQVVVQSFPDPSQGRWPVSIEGGSEPRWRRDGRELFYVDPNGSLMAVPVSSGPAPEIGTPVPLFNTTIPFPTGPSLRRYYDVSADGQRFLISTPARLTSAEPFTFVVNWKPPTQ
jgi:Tol biopolymer transport system component